MTWTCFLVGPRDADRFPNRAVAKLSHEERAHVALVAAGYDSLFLHDVHELRAYDQRRKRSRHVGIRNDPHLPGYALVRNPCPAAQPVFEMAIRKLTVSAGWRGTVPVVRAVLGPVIVGAAALDELLAAPAREPPASRLRAGGSAHIIAGYAAQAEPVLIEVLTRHGARVLIGSVTVEVPAYQLEAVA